MPGRRQGIEPDAANEASLVSVSTGWDHDRSSFPQVDRFLSYRPMSHPMTTTEGKKWRRLSMLTHPIIFNNDFINIMYH
jgi:hypothetical protein